MNSKEKAWIRSQLYKIWIEDNENDAQADDITEFLMELATKAEFDFTQIYKE